MGIKLYMGQGFHTLVNLEYWTGVPHICAVRYGTGFLKVTWFLYCQFLEVKFVDIKFLE